MTSGLVVGKFWPPHAGHDWLIEQGVAECDRLHVLVCDAPGQEPGAALRAGWLREAHPGVDVRVVPDLCGHDGEDCTPDCSRMWARAVADLGITVDVVYSSEGYGEEFARLCGARHLSVDPSRGRFPVSGRAVRADPAGHWEFLAPPVRAYYVRRVCVVGAESTGTTTMARALAARFGTLWVPEYGREHAVNVVGARPWTSEEFAVIACTQQQWEDRAAREVMPGRWGPLLFCDTDVLATSIWHERYMGAPSPEVVALAASRTYDLYLLTVDDIPFTQDGTRDGEHLRNWMTGRFREELAARSEPVIELRGSHDDRMTIAMEAVESMCATREDAQSPSRDWGKP